MRIIELVVGLGSRQCAFIRALDFFTGSDAAALIHGPVRGPEVERSADQPRRISGTSTTLLGSLSWRAKHWSWIQALLAQRRLGQRYDGAAGHK
jgi:hypothetical protein